jgi:hypothetical protein
VPKRGRPSDYLPEYADKAAKLCRLGAIDKDPAGFFDGSEVTVNAWKKAYPEFPKSIKAGKAVTHIHEIQRVSVGWVSEA